MADFEPIAVNTTAEKLEKIANMDVLTETVETENDNALVSATALLKTLVGNVDLSNYYIKIWQPNTEYKVGDVVYATSIGYNGATMDVIAKCTQAHTSSSGIFVDGDKWRTENIYAYSSICDGRGNVIEETYATKEELAEAIGQALEGDY